jgi:acyl carrier protein
MLGLVVGFECRNRREPHVRRRRPHVRRCAQAGLDVLAALHPSCNLPKAHMVTFDSFAAAFCEYFALDVSAIVADSLLVDDLGFDSIMYFELLLLLEDAAGFEVPDALLVNLITVGDVYHCYSSYTSTRSPSS